MNLPPIQQPQQPRNPDGLPPPEAMNEPPAPTTAVYQVRQILSSYPPLTEDLSPISAVIFEYIPSSPAPVRYGHEYALKCLSKADLYKDSLSTQMFEV